MGQKFVDQVMDSGPEQGFTAGDLNCDSRVGGDKGEDFVKSDGPALFFDGIP